MWYFIIFVPVILGVAHFFYPLFISIKAYVNNEPNELFPTDESKVRTYYGQYFSDSETPLYLVEALWSELLAYLNEYYFIVPYTKKQVPFFSEDYFINNPDAEFDFSSHNKYGITFWKKLIAKLKLSPDILEEYKGSYTFKELAEYIKPKLKAAPKILVVSNSGTSYSFFIEYLINYLGKDRIKAFSADSPPLSYIDPNALTVLNINGYPISDYKSHSLTDYTDQWFDILISVGDSSTKQTCMVLANGLARTHWDLAGVGQVTKTENNFEEAVQSAYIALAERTKELLNISIEALEKDEFNLALKRISEGF